MSAELPSAPIVPSNHADVRRDSKSLFLPTSWSEPLRDESGIRAGGEATVTPSLGRTSSDGQDVQAIARAELELDMKARDLYKAFLACPKYAKYRSGTKKKSDGEVWPDSVEWAFFRALIRIPPCGKCMSSRPDVLNGEDLGRNQRISYFIWKTIGVRRKKKQVSSHLQVLRGYVAEEPKLLGHLVAPSNVKEWHRKLKRKGLPEYPVSWEGIDLAADSSAESLMEVKSFLKATKRAAAAIEPWHLDYFEMSLCSRSQETDKLDSPLHTYCKTALADSQLNELSIDQPAECVELLPEIYMTAMPRPVGNRVLVVEASINLPEVAFSNSGSEIDIALYLNLQGPRVLGDVVVDTITTFYQSCNEIEQQERLGAVVEDQSPTLTSASSYQIPFCSSFWASTLSRLGNSHQRALALQTSPRYRNATTSARASIESESSSLLASIADELRSLTAVQQVSISSPSSPPSHLTLRWQFKLAPPHTPGHVSWRFVDLPAEGKDGSLSPTDSSCPATADFPLTPAFNPTPLPAQVGQQSFKLDPGAAWLAPHGQQGYVEHGQHQHLYPPPPQTMQHLTVQDGGEMVYYPVAQYVAPQGFHVGQLDPGLDAVGGMVGSAQLEIDPWLVGEEAYRSTGFGTHAGYFDGLADGQ